MFQVSGLKLLFEDVLVFEKVFTSSVRFRLCHRVSQSFFDLDGVEGY